MTTRPSFEALVDEFGGKIFNHAFRMLGTREDAEEATQDVFLKIHQGLPGFRGESQLSTWIWRITTNVCLTRGAKRKLHTVPLDEDEGEESVIDDHAPSNPEESFIAEESREQLARLINKLNPRESAAITLFYVDGLEYVEIARILDLPMGSVATHLHRGKKKLQALYHQRKVQNDV
ncbi:MAG TPA: RNA polymerase sigma factor [Bacteroidota bacterium]|nr:RNA polymerase sigma factor [Bacteroidota bacterium]